MHSLFIFNHWLKFIFFKKKIEILKPQDLLLMLEYALTLENLLDKIKVVSDLTIFDISLSSFWWDVVYLLLHYICLTVVVVKIRLDSLGKGV